MARANLSRYGTHEARLELVFLVASLPESVITHHPIHSHFWNLDCHVTILEPFKHPNRPSVFVKLKHILYSLSFWSSVSLHSIKSHHDCLLCRLGSLARDDFRTCIYLGIYG